MRYLFIASTLALAGSQTIAGPPRQAPCPPQAPVPPAGFAPVEAAATLRTASGALIRWTGRSYEYVADPTPAAVPQYPFALPNAGGCTNGRCPAPRR